MAVTAGNGASPRTPARSPDNRRIGQLLRSVRKAKNLRQRDLADRMREAGHDWHQNTVTRLESGKRSLLAREADDIARICDAPPDWYFRKQEQERNAA